MNYSVCIRISFLLFFFGILSLPLKAGTETTSSTDSTAGEMSHSERISANDLAVEMPTQIGKGSEAEVKIRFTNTSHSRLKDGAGNFNFIINGMPQTLSFVNAVCTFKHVFSEPQLSIYCEDFRFDETVHYFSYWTIGIPGFVIILILAMRRLKTS